MCYNLLDEEWIPVLCRDGELKRLGIRKAFEEADRIRQIAASNPMDRVAILRILLALLYWCKGNPPEGANSGGSFPREWFAKLDDKKDCFDLLGERNRFYQCASPGDKWEKLSSTYLIQEVPTGTNLWHFRHSTDGQSGLCPACCVLGLLRLPLFATSGGRGKPPGINAKPPIYVIPLGSSLADTLLLSWRETSHSDMGTPAWEKPDSQLAQDGNVPLLTGLTWLPRHVWLDNPGEPEASCIACGRRERLIRKCVFAGIGSTKTAGEGQGRRWNDPHVVRDGENVLKPDNALGSSDAAAGQWAKIMAEILKEEKYNDTRRVWVVGFATVQNDKYLEAMEYEIPLRWPPDTQTIRETIKSKVEMWRKEGSSLVRKVRPRAASRKRIHVEIAAIVGAIRPHVEGSVLSMSEELFGGDDGAWEQAVREYNPMMAVVAKALSPGYTTVAVQRRQQIAAVMPNMESRTGAARKHGRKKRGPK